VPIFADISVQMKLGYKYARN